MAYDSTEMTCEATESAKRKPSFAKARGVCRWCKQPKNAKRSTAKFCSDKCRSDFSNHQKKQGAIALGILLHWQGSARGSERGKAISLMEKVARRLRQENDEMGIVIPKEVPAEYHALVVGRNVGGGRRGNVQVSS